MNSMTKGASSSHAPHAELNVCSIGGDLLQCRLACCAGLAPVFGPPWMRVFTARGHDTSAWACGEVPAAAVGVVVEAGPVAHGIVEHLLREAEARDRVEVAAERPTFDRDKAMQVVVHVKLVVADRLHRLLAIQAVGGAIVAMLDAVEVNWPFSMVGCCRPSRFRPVAVRHMGSASPTTTTRDQQPS